VFTLLALQSRSRTILRAFLGSLKGSADFGRMGTLALHVAQLARRRTVGRRPRWGSPSRLVGQRPDAPLVARLRQAVPV